MTVKYGFYDSLNGDRLYNANDINTFFEGVFSDGVFELVGNGLQVENIPGTMNILVKDGRAWFNNLWIRNTSALTLSLQPSHMIYGRIDIVILEFDSSITVRENSIKIITGTPATIPIPPILTNTSTLNQYPLAHIYVGPSVSEILIGDITNKIGTISTPYARSIVSTPLSTESNDFQVGDSSGGWIKKTLLETITILRTVLDTIYPVDGRQVLTSNRTYYVRADGNDSNNGLSDTSNGAFLTIQKAIDTISILDRKSYIVTIKVGDGTYNIGTEPITLKEGVGSSIIYITGNITTPSNVIISSNSINSNYGTIFGSGLNTVYEIKGFRLVGNATPKAISIIYGTVLRIGNLEFSTGYTTYHIESLFFSSVFVVSNYSILSGGAVSHLSIRGGSLKCQGFTITLLNTPNFTYFCESAYCAVLFVNGSIFSGAANCTRYNATSNSIIQTAGGGPNFFPGTIAGTTSSGGIYL